MAIERNGDSGYGNGALVGSNESGTRAAIESRRVLRELTERDACDGGRSDSRTTLRVPIADSGADDGARIEGADSIAGLGASLDPASSPAARGGTVGGLED